VGVSLLLVFNIYFVTQVTDMSEYDEDNSSGPSGKSPPEFPRVAVNIIDIFGHIFDKT
jgi:hypothetical protein